MISSRVVAYRRQTCPVEPIPFGKSSAKRWRTPGLKARSPPVLRLHVYSPWYAVYLSQSRHGLRVPEGIQGESIYPDRDQKGLVRRQPVCTYKGQSKSCLSAYPKRLAEDQRPILTKLTKPVPRSKAQDTDAGRQLERGQEIQHSVEATRNSGLRKEEVASRRDGQTIFIHASGLSHRGVCHTLKGLN